MPSECARARKAETAFRRGQLKARRKTGEASQNTDNEPAPALMWLPSLKMHVLCCIHSWSGILQLSPSLVIRRTLLVRLFSVHLLQRGQT